MRVWEVRLLYKDLLEEKLYIATPTARKNLSIYVTIV